MLPLPIHIFPIPALKDNYIWAVVSTSQKKALIVDPGEALPVLQFLQNHHLDLSGILITHHHWDHTDGVAELKNKFQLPIFGPAEKIIGLTDVVKEVNQIKLDSLPVFQVLNIPGHTLKHIAYYAPGILFCGDTLFAAGCGRVFEGTMEEMYLTLQKIASLPLDTKIYCGHEYTLRNLYFAELVEPTNMDIKLRLEKVKKLRDKNIPSLPSALKEELATNPFLRCHETAVKTAAENYAKRKVNSSIEVFSYLRAWKDTF